MRKRRIVPTGSGVFVCVCVCVVFVLVTWLEAEGGKKEII